MKKWFLLLVISFVLAGTVSFGNPNQISNKKIEVSGAKIAPEKFELNQKQRLMVIVVLCIATGIGLSIPDKKKKRK